jgi:hypothetical protein
MTVVVTETQVDNDLKRERAKARDHFYGFRALTRTHNLSTLAHQQ